MNSDKEKQLFSALSYAVDAWHYKSAPPTMNRLDTIKFYLRLAKKEQEEKKW